MSLLDFRERLFHSPKVLNEVVEIGGVPIQVELGVRGDHALVKALHGDNGGVTKMSVYYPHEGPATLRFIRKDQHGVRETQFVDIAYDDSQLCISGSIGEEEEGSIVNLGAYICPGTGLQIPLDDLVGYGMQIDFKNIVFQSPTMRLRVPTFGSATLFDALKHPNIRELEARGLVCLTPGNNSSR